MSIIEIPAQTKCRCDRCGKEQPVPSERTWPCNWYEVIYRPHTTQPANRDHLCAECSDEFLKWRSK